MACGVPSVTTAISGIPELIEDGRNGLLVAPDDPEAVGRGAAPDRRATASSPGGCRRAARATVRERFDGDRLTSELVDAVSAGGGVTVAGAERSGPPRARVRPRPVFCVIDTVLPRPRGRRARSARGASPTPGSRSSSASSPTGSAPGCPPTRSGGSSGSSSITGSTSPTPTAGRARRASARVRAAGALVDRAGRARPRPERGHRAADLELGLRLVPVRCGPRLRRLRGRARGRAAGEPRGAGGARAPQPDRRRATTARSSSTRSSIAGAGAAGARSGRLAARSSRSTACSENLLADLRPDGVHCEASTHYHMVVLRSALGARENARRFGLRMSAAFDERLERACEFALALSPPRRPDRDALRQRRGQLSGPARARAPRCSAGPTSSTRRRRAARRAAAGALCASFPDGGYHVQRSGWGEGARAFEDELFLIFDCGPLGEGGHGHYDLLSVEVAGGGRPLLVDPGPLHLLGGAAEPAPLVQGHRGAQHRLRRRPRPDALPAREAEGTGRARDACSSG